MKTPVKGPIDADDKLIVNCNTDPSLSTTNTRAEIFDRYMTKLNAAVLRPEFSIPYRLVPGFVSIGSVVLVETDTNIFAHKLK